MSSWADVWTEEVDEETGAYYYYNSVTGVSQWERPAEFVESIPETTTTITTATFQRGDDRVSHLTTYPSEGRVIAKTSDRNMNNLNKSNTNQKKSKKEIGIKVFRNII